VAIPREHRPGGTSILVGERHGGDVRMPTLPKRGKPAATQILLAFGFPKNGASTVGHQGAQMAIAAFADAQ